VTVIDKISNFPLNSTRTQEAHYFCDINLNYMLKNYWSTGRGWTSLHVHPLNTPLHHLWPDGSVFLARRTWFKDYTISKQMSKVLIFSHK